MAYYYWIIVKFLIGFILIISYLNISGKTQLSQLTPIDFIGNFILGGIIGGITYNDEIPIYQYIIVLIIGILLIFFLNLLSKRFILFNSFTSGEPIQIIKERKFLMENILTKKNKIDIINIASQLRVNGIYSFNEIYHAQIEPSGQLSISVEKNKAISEIIMQSGKIRLPSLDKVGKNEKWLLRKIKRLKIQQEDIFLAEFYNGSVTFILNNGEVKKPVK